MEKISDTSRCASFLLLTYGFYDLRDNAMEQTSRIYLANLILCDHPLVTPNFATLLKALQSMTIPTLILWTWIFQILIQSYSLACMWLAHFS